VVPVGWFLVLSVVVGEDRDSGLVSEHIPVPMGCFAKAD
jgi:hypothetical protein